MTDILTAGIISLVVCLITGPLLIPVLRRLKFGQTVRSDGPESHLQKQGTPTMGGVMFFFGLTLGTIFIAKDNFYTIILLLFTLGFGLIGFIDDFIKIVKKRSLGLKAKDKILGQLVLSILLAWVSVNYLGRGTDIIIPITGQHIDLGLFYLPFVILVAMGTSNAVNLTDGLDGLAAGVTLFVALGFVIIGFGQQLFSITIFAMALVGSCLGFLFFNINPAKVFMGDTGSLALGGALAAMAVLTKTELILPIMGLVYVIETLSVIIQVVFFKLTKRRIFLMSPIHHHFELKGWSEQKVVLTFWSAAAIFVLLGLKIYDYTFM
ncbi:Phospho-N-acetylmuramoyl-pentapeptide-transferase [Desulfonispora thiosulfatigenes DSM 11270]|uniref:Phospho-N-acetylmuramoyl-pentapeptide-transferase n=1 Tax=Desulfonispora thiosulfatigenes DSM 11270 TaxID=656914 RepID=A0A1W1VSS5_DESTI|nr:phospho-N-acetylmuramoyl-pentapeptide-transferase [Desulfonispora thiosulfatigenes]SMB96435.1 Phospho-N-acetylmuramoyl-pentapeptide-transferase [Desulfonispora thiosulfatigenes DSM 11270]